MSNHPKPDHPVHELIIKRWSPYGFAETPVSDDDLLSLFEAARWAPSSYNEQPWSYIVATQSDPDAFARLLSCLVEANQEWARRAPVLVLCIAGLRFARNDKPNKAAVHDLGLAAGNLLFEATTRGILVHQMIGIVPDRARQLYKIPDGHEPYTAMAIGYAADLNDLPDALKQRDLQRRGRKPLTDFIFAGQWGTIAPLVAPERP